MEQITLNQLPEMVALILKNLERINAILEYSEAMLIQNNNISKAIEAAKFMGISMSLSYKLTSVREIAIFKPNGKKLYFKIPDLVDYLSKNRIITKQ